MADDKTSVDRRGFLKYAATGAVAAAAPGSMHAQDHDHGHDHQVMDLGCVLENKRMVSRCALSQTNLSDSRGSIGKEPCLIFGIYPRSRHNLRAIARPDLMFEGID